MIILKRVIMKMNVGSWTGLIWHRIGIFEGNM
jgi:hypothetical protein